MATLFPEEINKTVVKAVNAMGLVFSVPVLLLPPHYLYENRTVLSDNGPGRFRVHPRMHYQSGLP